MNYEQKYNEALERAKKIHDSPNASSGRKEWLESIFPELRESEDERIRKYLVEWVETLAKYGNFEIVDVKKYKPAEWSEEDEQWLESIIKDYQDRLSADKDHAAIHQIKIDFLKSLRPSWKPSEEQMEALHYVKQFDYGGHKAALVSLYEQLKAL